MARKKPFKDTTVGKILLGAAKIINPSLGEALEGVITPEDALKEITKADIPIEDKIKLQEMVIGYQEEQMRQVTDRWKADLEHGNWLTRSVRPLVLIFLIVSTVIMVFIDSGSIKFDVAERWTDLLQIVLITVIGAYFGGRSIEKYKK
jgi:hypothetical protein